MDDHLVITTKIIMLIYMIKKVNIINMDLIRLEVGAALLSCLLSEPAESARLPGRSSSYLSSLLP